jgi:cytochrome c
MRATVVLCLALAACGAKKQKEPAKEGAPKDEVLLCDGETRTALPAGGATTAAQGQAISDALMAQWKQKHPDVAWEDDVRRSHPRIPPPFDNRAVLANAEAGGQVYGRYSAEDVALWQRETEKVVLEGTRVFHDAQALGSTVSVSCDMCHPDAANTHPETYPKYQVQMGRTVLLRDMINWCIEHPLRGTPMAADDPRMRALEAYIVAQRAGTPLAYGKH